MLAVSDINALPKTPGEPDGVMPLPQSLSGNQAVVHQKRALCFLAVAPGRHCSYISGHQAPFSLYQEAPSFSWAQA